MKREECIGKTTLAIHAWKNPADREVIASELREKGCSRSYEAVFQRKDGSELFGLMSAAVFKLHDVPYVVSLTRDISERRQAPEALRQKVEALRVSNAELARFNRAMVGRELRMIEMKQEIDELCRRLGEPPRYAKPPEEGGA